MRMSLRRAVVAFAAAAALTIPAVATSAAGPSAAAPLPVPATRTFTAPIEAYAAYMGQTLCAPVARPGPLKLMKLLGATYGYTDYGIVRPCSDGGQSEHKEGRALDWMVSVRVPAQKAAATAFLAWLLAPDQYGTPGAMARRLGIMYIGWNNQIWRSYDPTRGTNGWDDLKGCSDPTSDLYKLASNDTYCHRNHIHLSFSWDGADATTSFWTGRAITVPDCEATASPPTVATTGVLVDSATGAGTAGATPCRLAVDRWAGDDHTVRYRVAAPPVGQGLKVRIERFASNAPGSIAVDTSATTPVRLTAATKLPYTTVLPVGANGLVSVSTNAGQAYVRVVALGYAALGSPPAAAPPATTVSTARTSFHLPAAARASASFALWGRATHVPAGAKVRRYLMVGTTFVPRGTAVRPTGTRLKWRMTVAAPSSAQTLTYRIAIVKRGTILGWSKVKSLPVS